MPADAEVDAFVRAIRDAGVRLIGLNFFAGDLAGPDAGVLSIPDRSAQFRDNLDVAVGIGEQLDVTAFNALYGNRIDGVAADAAGRARSRQPRTRRRRGRPDRRHRARRAGQRPQAVPAAHGRRCRGGGRCGPGRRTRERRIPLRPVPPGQQRRRRRRRDRAARRRHQPRADRRPSRSGRARQRRAGSRPPPRRPRRPRVRGLGGPGVQADHRHRDEPAVAADGAARGSRTSPESEEAHEHDWFHRPGDHGQPDGGPPAERRPRGERLQQAPRHRRPARRGGRPQGVLDRRRGEGRRRRRDHGA